MITAAGLAAALGAAVDARKHQDDAARALNRLNLWLNTKLGLPKLSMVK